jgi:Ca2+-binding RTX toxin-like protein
VIDGGSGNDTVDYASNNGPVFVNLADNSLNLGAAENDTYVSVENVVGTDYNDRLYGDGEANSLYGQNGNDRLYGGGGADDLYASRTNNLIPLLAAAAAAPNFSETNQLYGEDGNDRLFSGAGSDLLNGGAGTDEASYRYALRGGVVADLANVDNNYNEADGDTYVSIENLTGSTYTDRLYGNTSANTITGLGGHDTLNGGGGSDILIGGLGNDTYEIDGGDTIVELVGEGTDTVRTTVNYTLAANLENLALQGSAAISGAGNNLDNVLNGAGNTAANNLYGLGGNDTFVVGVGDTIVENIGGGTDTVSSSLMNLYVDNYAHVENATLTGTGNYFAIGSSGNNVLTGNSGNNLLNGSLGTNTLTGGAGQDGYIFNTAISGNVTTITDFNVVDDTLRVDNAIFTNIGANGTLNAAFFRIGAAALDSNDYMIYNSSTGSLSYDADGSGAGVAIQFATLSTGLALTNADFLVI